MTLRVRCFACGRFADEVTDGPSPDDDDVGQTRRWDAGVLDVHVDRNDCRAGVACWSCFWRAGGDLWTTAEAWDALSPLIRSHELPPLERDAEPERYRWPRN